MSVIKDLWDLGTHGIKLRLAEKKASLSILEAAGNLVTEKPTDEGWMKSDTSDRRKGHLEPDQMEMIRQARWFFRWDPNGRAALQTINNFVIGNGIKITPKDSSPMGRWVWREFWTAKRNKMRLKQFEIVNRAFRDGEVFIELFDEADGEPTGKTTIRFHDPLLIKNPSGTPQGYDQANTQNGIETDPDDFEKIVKYWVQSRSDENVFRAVPAEKMIHIKIFSDSDQRRGESWVQPVMTFFTHYKTWVTNRMILNKMRSAVVMVKKLTGNSSDVSRIAAQPPASSTTSTGEDKNQSIRGGTVLVANRGVDYEMMSANINAQDAAEDGRNIKLSIAAGTNLPEYIFGDASNANYSSSMVSESPFIKSIEFWRFFFEYWFGEIHCKVKENAVKAKILKAPNDEEYLRKIKGEGGLSEEQTEELMPGGQIETPTEIFFGIDAQWNEVIHRDMKAQAEALSVLRANGWVSDPTASAVAGFDWEEEVRKQRDAEEDAAENNNPLLKGGSDPMGDQGDAQTQAEIDDLLKGMTPDEKEEILKTNDPAALMKLVTAKMKMSNGKMPVGAGEGK